MIFDLLYLLTMAGFSACDVLIGVYMIRYAGASELDLGFIFMILPLAVITRPYLCAIADRYQTHKKLLTICLLVNALMYLPFVILPFILQEHLLATILTPRVCFWSLALCHLIGSVSFCGTRSLGDALAVNYAKRIGSDFTCYRKYGAISYGGCAYLLGMVNQGWILPDFTPTIIVHVTCLTVLGVLVFLWPEEHFVVISSDSEDIAKRESMAEIPNGKQVIAHMGSKLYRTVFFCSSGPPVTQKPASISNLPPVIKDVPKSGKTGGDLANYSPEQGQLELSNKEPLTTRQQMSIFLLLLRRDFRISLFLLLLAFGGIVGYAPRGFVFTYIDIFCHENKNCKGSALTGLVMISYCVVETICYMAINTFRSRLNNAVLLQVSLVSLAIHYYFYGFFLNNSAPYFFLIESLHGLEYAISLATSVDLAHYFASEVALLMPELIQRGIINERNDQKLVKVSLMATMNSCFTLAYDGGGSLIGAFLCGLMVENFSFTITWISIGTLSTLGFLIVLVAILVGKCLHLKPQIEKLKGNNNPVTALR